MYVTENKTGDMDLLQILIVKEFPNVFPEDL